MGAARAGTLALLTLVSSHWATGGWRTVSADGAEGMCDAEQEYYEPSIKICCQKCPKGTYLESVCGVNRTSQCKPCPNGSHAETWNNMRQCSTCRGECRQDLGLSEFQPCTPVSRRRCVCRTGTFCRTKMDAGDTTCSDCHAHRACPPGQGVSRPGDHSRDTLCKVCTDGTFSSKTSTTDVCFPQTNCTRLNQIQVRPGNGTADTECREPVGGAERRVNENSTENPLYTRGDSTSVSLGVLCTLLFIIALATTVCLLHGSAGERETLHLSCFKRVFQSCVVDAEAQVAGQLSPDSGRSEEFLFPAPPEVRAAPPEPCPKLAEEDLLRGRTCDVEPSADGSANQPGVQSTIEVTAVTDQAGFVGPVFIYNPSCVYMGLIRDGETLPGDRPQPRKAESRRSLPYPQQEAGETETERELVPEQENGKENHLSEEVSGTL